MNIMNKISKYRYSGNDEWEPETEELRNIRNSIVKEFKMFNDDELKIIAKDIKEFGDEETLLPFFNIFYSNTPRLKHYLHNLYKFGDDVDVILFYKNYSVDDIYQGLVDLQTKMYFNEMKQKSKLQELHNKR